MARLQEICAFLETLLDLRSFEDRSDNGLQIEGTPDVQRIALAVDACFSSAEEAVNNHCQLLLVHHGLLWSESVRLVGPNRRLFQAFLDPSLSLFAAHLPLDAHEQCGNNFTLARSLGLSELRSAVEYHGNTIGCLGCNRRGSTLTELAEQLAALPGAVMRVFPFGPSVPERVCIVSGQAAGELRKYAAEGFDTYISGEPAQFTYHFAKDHGVNVIFAGHYATETVGVRELGRVLEAQFGVETVFIDLPTGI